MSLTGILAIFVKTPEFSQVKTRLAAGIGQEGALLFYKQALEATAALSRQVKTELVDLDVVWAVAEEQGLKSDRWIEFDTVFQGEGDLGQKLHTVYAELLRRYDYVAFIGADSPHIPSTEIVKALTLTKKWRNEKFIIGETFDGGFYFFGGGIPLPKNVWTNIEYSSERTAQQLELELEKFGGIEKIEKNFDIDTIEDIHSLAKCKNRSLPEQTKLIEWARSIK